ncbi:MAG: FAD-dependent monooxygenase [Rhodobacteraceae bacterium]|nr:FAD-dependent monooxygenase [Paracoccaceae bacterium]
MSTNVIISGAGLGGLTAALALQRAGVPVKVYERAPALTEVGAGLSLGPNATRILHALGLESALREVCNTPDRLSAKHYQTGEIISEQVSRDYVKSYGAPYYQVHRADLMTVLSYAVLANDPSAIVLGHEITGCDASQTGVEVHCANGTAAKGDVLIGCDGVRSVLRAKLWNMPPPAFLGYIAYRGLTPVSALPEGLITPASATFNGPERHLTRYLIRGGTIVNYVAFVQTPDWVDEGWSVTATVDEVLERFAGWAPEVQHLIRNTANGTCIKWGLFGRAPFDHWTKGRVALLGDAAHPILPFLGQGASMAIEDGMILARALAEFSDPLEALRRYEAVRRPRANTIVEMSTEQGKRIHRAPSADYSVKTGLRPDIFKYDAVTEPI